MYDSSFTKSNLRHQLKYKDFVGIPSHSRHIIDEVVDTAFHVSVAGFPASFKVDSFSYRGNNIYSFSL